MYKYCRVALVCRFRRGEAQKRAQHTYIYTNSREKRDRKSGSRTAGAEKKRERAFNVVARVGPLLLSLSLTLWRSTGGIRGMPSSFLLLSSCISESKRERVRTVRVNVISCRSRRFESLLTSFSTREGRTPSLYFFSNELLPFSGTLVYRYKC